MDKNKRNRKNDFIYVTPKELFDLIGRSGGMFLSGLTNDREKRFVKLFYQYKPQIQRNENRN